LELNYDLSKQLTATSVTGFYKYDFFNRANFTGTSYPAAILGSINALDIREISEEVRLTSNFEGRINFMVGAQYQNSKTQTASVAAFGAIPGQLSILGRPSPFLASSYYLDQGGNAYSAFAQLQFKILPELELSAGGRYSEEAKTLPSVFNRNVQLVGTSPFLSDGNERKSFNNFSPEVSLAYRPTGNLNVYGTYKEGFLSGGFNGGSFNAAGDLSYKPERVKGWEAGVKGRFFDDTLNADLALYTYGISDLQVQVTTNGTVQELKNAGKVSSKGVELGLNYRPIKAFSLYGNVAYARGRYDSYYATCYAGQAVLAPGTGVGQCGLQPNPTNNNVVGLLQNLSGTELGRSPKWTGNAGLTYDTDVSSTMTLGFTGGVTYSDSYIESSTSQPRARQPSYTLLDASLRLAQIDDKWALSFIGRNLSNKFYVVRGTDNPTGVVAPTRLADTFGVVSRGREYWLRTDVKF
jgi:iron complex outermembrane receptor protein